ncbi:MAG TPA: DUF120 domain-containing protein [Candidatus Methanoperedenaceae archaeon]|nr:DUF120 domain-containing protein [Candidatus Methanoperedenaceae archaeon]
MDTEALKKLALLGAMEGSIRLSSAEFASHISASTQTAARRLQELTRMELIVRDVNPAGQVIRISERGKSILHTEYIDYRKLFEGQNGHITLCGSVVTGLGEGQYYMVLEGYRKQFVEKLGFTPFPGTLNLKLDPASMPARRRLGSGILVHGFTDQNRTFGGAKCYPVRLDDVRGAIIVPDRTHYPEDVIEIISPVNLREHGKLRDGSQVRVEVIE